MIDDIKALTSELIRRQKEEPVRRMKFHRLQKRFIEANATGAVILYGANRTGKTQAGAARTLIHMKGVDHPLIRSNSELHKLAQRLYKGREWRPVTGWVVSIDRDQQVAAAQYKLIGDESQNVPGMLPLKDLEIAYISKRQNYVSSIFDRESGSKLVFHTNEEDPKSLQGAGLDFIWFDEEPKETIYRESVMRVEAGHYLDLFFTLTPLNGLNWFYKKFISAVRSEAPFNYKIRGHRSKTIYYSRMSIDDNCVNKGGFLSVNQVKEIKERVKDDPQALARLEGKPVNVGVNAVFEPSLAQYYLDQEKKPIGRKDIVGCNVLIYEYPDENGQYVIGVDPAEGIEHDYSVAQVFRRARHDKLTQVAVMASNNIDADLFADAIYELATLYRKAFLVIEQNNHGHTVIAKLWRGHGYTNQYIRQASDIDTKSSIAKSNFSQIGFQTTKSTKPSLIDLLKGYYREKAISIPDATTIDEMIAFEINHNTGSFSAPSGMHDDRVIATALAVWGDNNYVDERRIGAYDISSSTKKAPLYGIKGIDFGEPI